MTTPLTETAPFQLDERGFLNASGPARARGDAPCHVKLMFTATRRAPLLRVLSELLEREDCFYAKLDAEPGPHGMFRGRCFLTSEDAVGEVWRTYKNTNELLTSVQDDRFTARYRD